MKKEKLLRLSQYVTEVSNHLQKKNNTFVSIFAP